MTSLTCPLSVGGGVLWLGAPPNPGGRGIALAADHIALHPIDAAMEKVPWDAVRGLSVTIEISRWRHPALASWRLGMLGAAVDIFSPGVPDDIDVHIDTVDGPIEHAVSAHNRGGYPRDKVEALIALLGLLVADDNVRASLQSPEDVKDAFNCASVAVNKGESPTTVLLSLVA